MKKNYEELVKQILAQVGGKDNIVFVTHCMTRLRFNLKDESRVKQEDVKAISGVLGCQFSAGQFQIIIGQSVNKVYDTLCKVGGLEKQTAIDEDLDTKVKQPFSLKRLGNDIMNGLTGCLTPIIPILILAGLIKMMVSVCGPSMLNVLDETDDLYRLLTLVGDAGFYYFPVFVGLSGAKKFGCSPMYALLIAGIMLHPAYLEIVAAGNPFTVYGIPMTLSSYASSVMPMILITFVMSYVEKFFKTYIPEAISLMFVPLCTILVMLPVALCILGPLGVIIGTLLTEVLIALHEVLGPLGVAVIASLWILLVATGMHLPLVTTALVSMATLGYDSIVFVGASITVYASAAISLGVFIKAKDAQTKGLGASCLVAQVIGGVGEPTIFGILLRYKKTLLFTMTGIFFGALYAGFMNVSVYIVATSNALSALAFSGSNNSNLIHGCIGCAIAFVISFALMMVFGFEDKKIESEEA